MKKEQQTVKKSFTISGNWLADQQLKKQFRSIVRYSLAPKPAKSAAM